MHLPVGAALRRGLYRGLGHGRQPAVGRVDDERRPLVGGQLDAPLVPELVVGEHAPFRARPVAGGAPLGVEEVAVQAHALRRLERGRLLRVQPLAPLEPGGALERRQGAEREGAGHVRLAVRGPHRHRAVSRLRRGRRRRECDRDGQHDERRHILPEHLPASPRRPLAAHTRPFTVDASDWKRKRLQEPVTSRAGFHYGPWSPLAITAA